MLCLCWSGGLWSPRSCGFEAPVWCRVLCEVVAFVAVAVSVAGLFVVEGVGTPFVDGDDVVDVEAAGVEVWQGVVDCFTADAAWWFVACDGASVSVSDGGVAWCCHRYPCSVHMR